MIQSPITSTVEAGYELQIGDTIVTKHAFGNNRLKVIRLTKKYAIVKFNDVAEGKYPRIFNSNFHPIPRQQWDTTTYRIEKARP